MKTKHTPTPWIWKKAIKLDSEGGTWFQTLIEKADYDDPEYNGGGAILLHEAQWKIKKANAEFIVKACNSHDELVAEVEGFRKVVENQIKHRAEGAVKNALIAKLKRIESVLSKARKEF